ncbi:hypothetical protein E1295_47125 [Nonomuraea mesophila]|uniref:Uncharacterized protein n=1 Tax=Nonomuraea mesophila TaxID=2530382 RepID=A0A4R5DY26_9ACTN|nr:hypothetical protein [Nonomuraea mesophila]TDE20491.1 hypothetical protein E1295_47125 [Nonomuraea mesophila]
MRGHDAVVVVRNGSSADPPPDAPVKDDGRPYRFEMIFAGGSLRGYADDMADLVGLLVAGYGEPATDGERAAARVRLAMDAQVGLQARLAAGHRLDACDDAERAVILGGRHEPPAPVRWEAPVPLVLVATFYEPQGPLPRPQGPADLQIWLDPAGDRALLTSLHAAGAITLNVRAEAP